MKRQLNKMTLRELQAHSDIVQNMIETRTLAANKLAAAKEAHGAASRYGFTLADLVDVAVDDGKKPKRRERKRMGKIPPKYQSPSDLRNTWSGRGRKPQWARDHLASGGSMDDLLIAKAE